MDVHRRFKLMLFLLLAALALSANVEKVAGDESPDAETSPTTRQRIASLFRTSLVQPEDEAEPDDPGLSALSELEGLLSEPVLVPGQAPATLTAMETQGTEEAVSTSVPRKTPAAVTRIDAQTIWSSGARSLNELFDIYVPNVQIIRHHFGQPHVGIRGIIKDRDDHYLLLVNGKVMNHRTQEGAYTERDLPTLGDIHHVDFIRGPGSAIYGPGGISGVVNIVTHNALTFEGMDATVRQGFIEEFTSVEIRKGIKFSDDSGLFLYYGFTDYTGSDQGDSPYVFGHSYFPRGGGPLIPAGTANPFPIPDDHAAYRGHGKHKMHIQYTHGNFDAWFRYTNGGEILNADRRGYMQAPLGSANNVPPNFGGQQISDINPNSFGYQQFTAFATYNFDLTDQLNLQFRLSYDALDFERLPASGVGVRNHLEQELYGRALATWTPNDCNALAFGIAYSREIFAQPSPGFPNEPTAITQRQGPVQPWTTDTLSLLAEWQWNPNDWFTAFVGARGDNHTYTHWLFSPRVAMVITPNDCDTFKIIANQSVRRTGDDELRAEFVNTGTQSEAEVIQALETRWERQQTDNLWLASSVFAQKLDLVARDSTLNRNVRFGRQVNWGVEVEAAYRTEKTNFVVSHAYTGLLDFSLLNPSNIQGFSSSPYGFGDDLANWSPNLTKLYVNHDFNCCWSMSSSLRVYWGFPGAKDQAQHNQQIFETNGTPNGSLAFVDPGHTDPFRANVYWNYGVERRFGDRFVLRADLYNILGWFDIELNKRNYILRPSEWRAEAPAVGISGRFTF